MIDISCTSSVFDPMRILIPSLLILSILSSGCEERFRESRFLLGTVVEITVIGDRSSAQHAMKRAFDEIKRIDDLMNVYNENSEITRINRSAGKSAVIVSPDTLNVIEQSLKFAELTGGALDITVGPLMELWGFRGGKKKVPSYKELSEKLPLVDYKKVVVDKAHSSVKAVSPGMQIDVGAIAVGYAVDRAVGVLKEEGIKSALVNAGGEIYALGSPPGKHAWRIGIQHPRRRGELLGILRLKDKAVSTSGDYENFFQVNGRRYCHIMNPKTGKPVEGIMSVTVIADGATEADALSTALFPLGAKGGMKLVEEHEGLDCIIVTGEKEEDMNIIVSSGIKDKVEFSMPEPLIEDQTSGIRD